MKRHPGDNPTHIGTEGLELFARRTDPVTSHQAAASMVEEAGRQRQLILDYLEERPEGATADEIDQALAWRPTTAGRRLGELLSRSGKIWVARKMVRLDGSTWLVGTRSVQMPRVTRKTRSGREALVHIHRSHLDHWLKAQ